MFGFFVFSVCMVLVILLILLINYLFRKNDYFVKHKKLLNITAVVISGIFSLLVGSTVYHMQDFAPGPNVLAETLSTDCSEILEDATIKHFFNENDIKVDKCRKSTGNYNYMDGKTYSEFSGVIETKKLRNITYRNKIDFNDQQLATVFVESSEPTKKDSFNHFTYGDFFNSFFNKLKEYSSKMPPGDEIVWTNFYNLIPDKVVRILYDENLNTTRESLVFITVINTTEKVPPAYFEVK